MSTSDIGSSNTHGTNPMMSPLGNDQTQQPDQVETDILTNLNALQLDQHTLLIDDTDSTPTYDDSEGHSSPIVRPEGWDSDESHDSGYCYHEMTRHALRLYREQRERGKTAPIQAHLETLHHAFRNVDPKYTIFAFGGSIPSTKIKCEDLKLRVWKQPPPPVKPVDGKNTTGYDGRNKISTVNSKSGGGSGNVLTPPRRPQGTGFQFPLMGEEIEKLKKFAHDAPFGKGKKTVYDKKYRQAMQITPERYEISPDPISTTDILDQIAKTLHMPCRLRAERAKLNIYSPGGFFDWHVDTLRSPQHIGTIVVSLPGAYAGGQLEVSHGGSSTTFDWGRPWQEYQNIGPIPFTEIQWAFLYGDCGHMVERVVFGDRLTIAYDVFTASKRDVYEAQAQSDDIYKALQLALDDRSGFAKDGCILAFGLSHSYPKTPTGSLWEDLEARLKVPDAVLLQAINRSGLAYSFKAAFRRGWPSFDADGDEAREWGIAKEDKLSNTVLNAIYRNGLTRFEVILTDKPDALEGLTDDEFDEDQQFYETIDQDQDEIKGLVWVDYPQSYGFLNKHYCIGNACEEDAQTYSGVAVLIEIPPAYK